MPTLPQKNKANLSSSTSMTQPVSKIEIQEEQPSQQSQITEEITPSDSSSPELEALENVVFDTEPSEAPQTGATAHEMEQSFIMDKDAFYELYLKGGFNMIEIALNAVNSKRGLPKLTSVSIQADEEDAARAASDALYNMCARSTWLRWMIEPANENMQAVLAIGMFSVMKITNVREEFNNLKPMKGGNDNGKSENKEQTQEASSFDGVHTEH